MTLSFELPLFPLRTVLFPSVKLALHIFEDRYRLMIQRCMDADRRFGIVLIAQGQEVGHPAVPHPVGTIAHIIDVDRLQDGRMNLAVRGTERFKLVESWEVNAGADKHGYLQGRVEIIDDSPDEPDSLNLLAMKTHALFDRYVVMLTREADRNELLKSLPSDPLSLSFVISAAMPVSMDRKQSLLELTSTGKRLHHLCGILKQQITLREVIERARTRELPPQPDADCWTIFSPN